MGVTRSAFDAPGPVVRAFRGLRPRVAPDAWLAPGAVVVGDVEIGSEASVWYGAVLRGDVNAIRIGARSNLQDQCVVHVTRDRFDCEVGEEVTVGHRATVHGCVVEDGALVGIGAIVLDGARIGTGAVVAAGAVVPPGAHIAPRSLAVGIPARVVRTLEEAERERNRRAALAYVALAREHAGST